MAAVVPQMGDVRMREDDGGIASQMHMSATSE